MTRRYLIIGPQGAGKSTFGAALAEALGTDAVDTSAWIKRILRRTLGREPTRPECVALGDAVCADDPAFLVDRCFETGARVACGARRREEVAQARERWPDLVVVFLRRPAGPEAHLDTSNEVDGYDADIVLAPRDLAECKEMAGLLARGGSVCR